MIHGRRSYAAHPDFLPYAGAKSGAPLVVAPFVALLLFQTR